MLLPRRCDWIERPDDAWNKQQKKEKDVHASKNKAP